MNKEQIERLAAEGIFPEESERRELIETHISWVIICDHFVYKLKKPVKFSFLDFSSLELRKLYCEKEMELNRRITKDVYLEVLPIRASSNKFSIGGEEGSIIDYAVKMNKLDNSKQMDILLSQNLVSEKDMKELAKKISAFHETTTVIYEKELFDLQEKFNDLGAEKEYLAAALGTQYGKLIEEVLNYSDAFLKKNAVLISDRLKAGFYRDCHGDLHSRNIFLLPEPIPFDCIEFNTDFRQIDVLNEVAFLCMDLDAFDRPDLSEAFLKYYNAYFPTMKTKEDFALFVYYKMYRANIRAKVNSLRSKSAVGADEKAKALAASKLYLDLLESYKNGMDEII